MGWKESVGSPQVQKEGKIRTVSYAENSGENSGAVASREPAESSEKHRRGFVYSARVVLDRWRFWEPGSKRAELAHAFDRERRWTREGSNCPQPLTPVDWDEITTDNSIVMVSRVERFFQEHPEWHPQKAAVLMGKETPEFFAAWERWYMEHPVLRPSHVARKNDRVEEAFDLVDLVREWNSRNPLDSITYDALRKAKSEGRLQCFKDGRSNLAWVAKWRFDSAHGGKREGAGRKKVA